MPVQVLLAQGAWPSTPQAVQMYLAAAEQTFPPVQPLLQQGWPAPPQAWQTAFRATVPLAQPVEGQTSWPAAPQGLHVPRDPCQGAHTALVSLQ